MFADFRPSPVGILFVLVVVGFLVWLVLKNRRNNP